MKQNLRFVMLFILSCMMVFPATVTSSSAAMICPMAIGGCVTPPPPPSTITVRFTGYVTDVVTGDPVYDDVKVKIYDDGSYVDYDYTNTNGYYDTGDISVIPGSSIKIRATFINDGYLGTNKAYASQDYVTQDKTLTVNSGGTYNRNFALNRDNNDDGYTALDEIVERRDWNYDLTNLHEDLELACGPISGPTEAHLKVEARTMSEIIYETDGSPHAYNFLNTKMYFDWQNCDVISYLTMKYSKVEVFVQNRFDGDESFILANQMKVTDQQSWDWGSSIKFEISASAEYKIFTFDFGYEYEEEPLQTHDNYDVTDSTENGRKIGYLKTDWDKDKRKEVSTAWSFIVQNNEAAEYINTNFVYKVRFTFSIQTVVNLLLGKVWSGSVHNLVQDIYLGDGAIPTGHTGYDYYINMQPGETSAN